MPKKRFTKSTKTKVKKLQKQVATLIRAPERKAHDSVISVTMSTSGGTHWPLNGLVQGTTNLERIGNKITLKSLRFRILMNSADVYNNCRIMLVKLRPELVMLPPVDLVQYILEDPLNFMTSFYKRNGNTPYKVIVDKRYTMGGRLGNHSGASATTIGVEKLIDINCPIKKGGIAIDYDNSSNNVGDTSETFVLIGLSDSGVTPYPQLNGFCRAVFTDQ